jgi:uncharacterized protein YciI
VAKYAVELVFGDNQDERLAVRPAHRDYIRSLVAEGRVLAAGPYADQKGALLVYEVADEAELGELLEADPYTPAGVVTETRVREWETVTGTWL